MFFLPWAYALAGEPSAAPGGDTPAPSASPPPEATPPPPTLEELAARIRALEDQLAAAQAEQFRRDAEAAAAAPATPSAGPQTAVSRWAAFNPGLTAFGDLVGQIGVDGDGVMPGSTLTLRSLEIEVRADVDPFAKADAVIALEQELPDLAGGAGAGFDVAPEEAYIDLVALPWRLSSRVGKFRVPFGIANRMHPHDLPWIDPPRSISSLGDEGYIDTGGTLAWVGSAGPVALTVTAGLFGGEPWDPDNARANLNALGRAELFFGLGSVDLAIGGSAVQDVTSDEGVQGADLMLRWRPDTRHSVALLGEGFRAADGRLSGYGAVQVQPSRGFYVGVREDVDEGLKSNLYLSYYTSEFLRFRVGGGFDHTSGVTDGLAQLTFVWGSHPVEPWWVNQ